MHFFKIFSILLSIVVLSIHVANATGDSIGFDTTSRLHKALFDSIKIDNEVEVRQIIAFGADVNYRYEGSKTPLMVASELGKTKSVKTLLELGSKHELKSTEDMTALDYARKNKHAAISNTLEALTVSQPTQTKRQIITTIQYYLNRLGYVAGNLDGIYGTKTRNSLKQFSRDFNQNFPVEISERQIEEIVNQTVLISKTTSNEPQLSKEELKKRNSKTVKSSKPPRRNLSICGWFILLYSVLDRLFSHHKSLVYENDKNRISHRLYLDHLHNNKKPYRHIQRHILHPIE